MKKAIWIAVLSFCPLLGFAQRGGYADDLYRSKTGIDRKANRNSAKTTVVDGAVAGGDGVYTYVPQAMTGGPGVVAPDSDSDVGGKELIISYDEAMQRRLNAWKTYREMDDDYWNLMERYRAMLTIRYDRDFYNVITFGNEIWVEPKYITALFDGSDPAAGVMSKELAYSNKQLRIGTSAAPVSITFVNDWDLRRYDPWDYDRYRYYGGWNAYRGWGRSYGYYDYFHDYDYYHYYRGGGYYPSFWGWNSGWGWGSGWYAYGPPYYPGSYYPPHRPPVDGGRPVIRGGGSGGGGGGGPAGSIRPTSSGYRRNENGTNVSIRPNRRAITNTTTTTTAPARNTNTNANTRQNTRRETTTPTYTPAPSTPSNTGGGSGAGGGGGVRRR